MSTQDWNEVVITKKKPSAGTTVKDVDAVRRALPLRGVCCLFSRAPAARPRRVTLTQCGVRRAAQARRAGAQVAAVKKCACRRARGRRAKGRRLWVLGVPLERRATLCGAHAAPDAAAHTARRGIAPCALLWGALRARRRAC
jgi:hypothetical protein